MLQFTRSGLMRAVRLGQEIGRGGEGAVFAVEGQKDRVAKIYSSPPDRGKAQKLVAMSEAANPSLLKIAAWPDTLLRDKEGVVRGFTMPRAVARRDIHELYTPKSRLKAFPEADFRFLVHVAANVARAFAVVHEQGHVVGDVNHGNLLVGADGTVMFIDCDSFQVGNGATVFTCDVGSPLFTAPELQGRPFRGLLRTANHDRFGLAVLLFHLLFMGRHPFLGGDSDPGHMPPDKAIAEYRFAYGPNGALEGMERPPNTVPLEAMGEVVARHFIQAFGPASSRGIRPDAKTWVRVLEKLRSGLQMCLRANWHHYPGWLAACPWCTVESRTGVRLFGQRIGVVAATGTMARDTPPGAVSAIPEPDSASAPPPERSRHSPPGVKVPSANSKIFREILIIICGIGSLGLVANGIPAGDIEIVVAALIFCGFAYAVWDFLR